MADTVLEYGKLLTESLPEVIHDEEDYTRFSGQLETLLNEGDDSLRQPEVKLLALLGVLLQDYERRRFRLGETATPHSVWIDAQGCLALARLAWRGLGGPQRQTIHQQGKRQETSPVLQCLGGGVPVKDHRCREIATPSGKTCSTFDGHFQSAGFQTL